MTAEEGLQGFVIPPRANTSPPVLRAPRESLVSKVVTTNAADAAVESEEDIKRHYQSYHDHYYGITPRDPRLAVPLKPIYPNPPADEAASHTKPISAVATLSPQQASLVRTPDSISFSAPGLPGAPPVRDHTPPPERSTPTSRQLIAQAGTTGSGQQSPDRRSTRSPGTTHQPYATTPMTPDCLPSNLLQSPAQFSLDGHGSFAGQDQYGRRSQTLFAAPNVPQQSSPMQSQSGFSPNFQSQDNQVSALPATGQWRAPAQNQQQQPQNGGRRGRHGRGSDSNSAQLNNSLTALNQSTTSSTGNTQKSALLQSFHDDNVSRANLTLPELVNHMVEFSTDQDGSRLIQRLMVDENTSAAVLSEILPHSVDLMVDVFGNYVIQRLLETGSQGQRTALIQAMQSHVVRLALQTYGCRVVQKALHYATPEEQRILASELEGHVAECVRDQNGNHVIQKCIEMMPTTSQFLAESFVGNLPGLASHAYGCRVMQRLFERCPNTDPSLEKVVYETLQYSDQLINDQYGNYVMQHILINGTPAWRRAVLGQIKTRFAKLSCAKFSSNVTEKLFVHGEEVDRAAIIDHIITECDKNDCCSFVYMMQDQYANYVVQKIVDLSSPQQKERIINSIKPWVSEIRRFTYGKHIVARLEKMGLLPPGSSGPPEPTPAGGRGERGDRGGRGGRGGNQHQGNGGQNQNQSQNQNQNHQMQTPQQQSFMAQQQGLQLQQQAYNAGLQQQQQALGGGYNQQMFQQQQPQGFMPQQVNPYQQQPANQFVSQQVNSVAAPQPADFNRVGGFGGGQPLQPQAIGGQYQQQQQFNQQPQQQQQQQSPQGFQAPMPISSGNQPTSLQFVDPAIASAFPAR